VTVRTRWLSHIIVGLSCAAAGALGVAGLTSMQPPQTLEGAAEARTAAVSVSQFRDERTVAAEIDALQPSTAALGTSGTITSTACVPGGELTAGKIVASVNGRPVLGLHTEVPLYRDIGPGAEGADVNALRVRLAAMGYPVTGTGGYSADLGAALLKLQKDFGLHKRDGLLHLGDIVWLPGGSVRVRSCDALLGSQYSAGTPFLTTAGTLQSLRVVFPDGQPPAPGDRQVYFGGASAALASDGLVTERLFLDEVAKSAEFAAAQSANSSKPLSVKTALKTPLDVVKVPVSGVFAVKDNTGCVKSTQGVFHPLKIAGSSLGTVLATFDTTVPGEILLGKAIGTSECRS
jgi:hypothetical protein